MATWGLHIRIAEALLEKGYDFNEEKFLVGNIGPDCGQPNDDWSKFDPPTEISHWIDCKQINPENFYNKYLKKENEDLEMKSFYIGYFVHLLTDNLWRNKIKLKKRSDENYAELNTNEKFIWTIKKDWYDLDHLYFRDNPESIFHRIFKNVEEFPNYLDYYPKGAVIRQVKFITNYYLNPSDNLDRKYLYLNKEEMNIFVNESLNTLESILSEKLLD